MQNNGDNGKKNPTVKFEDNDKSVKSKSDENKNIKETITHIDIEKSLDSFESS